MKFGAELEFTANMVHFSSGNHTFYTYLQKLVGQSNIKNWKIEQDNSCGNEIVSPILEGEQGLKELLHVCYCANKAAEYMGASRLSGLDCGIHFHYDARSMNHIAIRNILVATAMIEPLFYAMNPMSRFGTNFAAPLNFNMFQCLRARDMVDLRDIWFRSYMGVSANQDSYRVKSKEYYPEFINNATKAPHKYDWTRYHGLNFVALFKHKTIEYRYAQCSFDEHTIEMWYRLFYAIVDACITTSTRKLLKSNFPYKMGTIKQNGMAYLQRTLFNDLGKIIKFLFVPQRGTKESFIKPDLELIKFIANRIFKYAANRSKLFSIEKVDNAKTIEEALDAILEKKIPSTHGRYLSFNPSPMHE